MNVFFTTLLIIVSCEAETRSIKPVTVFNGEEAEYHKYSAILAATEPFRLQRDKEIRRSMNPIKFMYHKLKG